MNPSFTMLSELCSITPDTAWRGGLLLGLFVAGVVGSAMHCVPMCGGFVLGQVADRMTRQPAARLCEWQRAMGLLPFYHLGRLSTYVALGALAATAVSWSAWFRIATPSLLALGATLFLLHAMRRLIPTTRRWLPAVDLAPGAWTRSVAWLAQRAGGGSYALGVILGFLPCGFLYAALAASAAGGSPLLGGLGMLAFGLGTVPSLMVVGVAGQAMGRCWRCGLTAAAPAVMLLNAALLLVLALRGLSHDL